MNTNEFQSQCLTRSSTVAETAHIMIRSAIAIDQLILTVTLHMTCVDFI